MFQESGLLSPEELAFIRSKVFDLRSTFYTILNKSFDGETEDSTEEDSADDGEESEENEDSSTASGKADIKNPKLKELSDEAARRRREAREAQKERDEVRAKLKEYEDKDKSEVDKLKSDLQEAKTRAEKAEQKAQEKEVRLAFFDSGAANQFRNPATALRLLDLADLKPNEDGEIDHAEVKKRADDLLKKEPYLAREDSDTDTASGGSGQPSGRQTNGRKGDRKGLEMETLARKFPALRGRG